MAFQNTTITNLRVIGQLGLEVISNTEGKAFVKVEHSDWSDSTKIVKRVCNENIIEVENSEYEIDMKKIKGTCAIIEYIVSPNIIQFNNFPMYAVYNIEQNEAEYIVQLKYQVSTTWKSALDEVVFIIMLDCYDIQLVEANLRGEIVGSALQWKANKLTCSQKGILQARLRATKCSVDHAKILFKSVNTNLSQISATFGICQRISNATSRFMAEIVISNN